MRQLLRPADQYRCRQFQRFPLGDGSEAVYAGSGWPRQILSPDQVHMLEGCRTFDTLEGHACRIGEALGLLPEQRETMRTQLSGFASSGLLFSKLDLIERCKNQSSRQEAPPKISSIAIITKDRPDGLHRAAVSYLENCKQYGRDIYLLVMDDSSNGAGRETILRMLRGLSRQYSMRVLYAGQAEKTRFVEQLTKLAGLPPEATRFALLNDGQWANSCGANRNAHLLQTMGEMAFTADDDTVCRIVSPPEPENGLRFVSGCDPAEFWFYPDRETLLHSVNPVAAEPLALQEEFLGREVGSLVADIGEPSRIDFDLMEPRMLQEIGVQGGAIAATFPGHLGDPGWAAPFGYAGVPVGCLMLLPDSHQRMTRSERDYRSACASRALLRVAKSPAISDTKTSGSTFIGLDNRKILPPFMPVGRSQDVIFGVALSQCVAGGYCAHLPWALLHAPIESRRFWPGEIFRTASGLGMANVLIECIRAHAPVLTARGTALRLRDLGQYLMELGSLPQVDFMRFLRRQVCSSMTVFITLMNNHLQQRASTPRYWAADLEKYMALLSQSLAREDYFVPLDLVIGRTVEEARVLAQDLVRRYGNLLYWWPAIIEATNELHTQNRLLAKPV